ncbi:MAG: FeoA domain-containing protein [Cyclobacteriaceae bacterium]
MQVSRENLAAKLTEMGLYPGKQLQVLFKAPFGDPIAIDVGGYTLSLRKSEAALIQLED